MMIAIRGYSEGDLPSFCAHGVKIDNPPDGPFEAKVKLQITKQITPVYGDPYVEFSVLEMEPEGGVDIEEMDFEKQMDSGDSLAAGLEKAAMKKAGMDSEDMGDSEEGD